MKILIKLKKQLVKYPLLSAVYRIAKSIIGFVSIVRFRMQRDKMTVVAGNLAYVSILSLIPLLTVLFFLLSAFPMFEELSWHVKNFVFQNLVPTAHDSIRPHIEQFIENSTKMTAIGTVGLMVTSLLLIKSIDVAINHIWGTTRKRPFMFSFAVYWMILSLGPVLLGFSIAISSYLFSLKLFNADSTSFIVTKILGLVPFLFSLCIFWVVYSIVPTRKVKLKDSFAGAVVAGILFELSKKVFAIYITLFPTYEIIYGVLSIIPILFMWIYLCWCIVLFGAEISASIGSLRLLAEKDIE